MVLKPESASLSWGSACSKPGFPSGDADVLAGESPADDIDWFEVVLSGCSDIEFPVNAGPPRFKDAVAEGVDFDLPDRFYPGPFKPQLYAAYAAEKAPMTQLDHWTFPPAV
jgi:hypothetical protein